MSDILPAQLQAALGAAYTLERELGGGGMSRVFVAEETRFRRRVVVKVLAPALATRLSTERFEREIAVAAGLQHPNIVPVLTAGEVDGLPWYTMPFVDGESLRARLAAGRLTPGAAIAVLRDVARALAFAHARGVVHRDVKPENVLLAGDAAVVTDFGIAKALAASATHTLAGATGKTLTHGGASIGTPAYMAPEQAAGDAVDHRADLYAWGVLAYELLAGQHPFAGKATARQLIAAQIAETPAPLATVAPDVAAPLAAIVTHCLAKDATARPASAAEVLEALDAARTDPGLATDPGSRTGPAAARGRAARRARRTLALGAAGALLALAGAGVVAWRARGGGAPAPPLVAVLPFDSEGPGADPAFADGLGDAVTGKLARLAGLRVIDRKSVLSVGDGAVTPQAAGRALGAEYVLRAAVRWAAGPGGEPRVQVSPVLVRVADGTTRWAGEPRVVSPADPFAVQAVVAADVAEALDVALGSAERARLERPATTSTAALAAVERGQRIAFGESPSDDVYARALAEFERAYARDPEYADAYGWAAHLMLMRASHGAPGASRDSAVVLARRALALDPGQAVAANVLVEHESVNGRHAAARQLVERAVDAYPSNGQLRLLQAELRLRAGDVAGTLVAMERAVQLAPRDPLVTAVTFDRALAIHRLDVARELLARWQALAPNTQPTLIAAARLADAAGDQAALGRAMRDARARGAVLRAVDLQFIRRADPAVAGELAHARLETYHVASPWDSLRFYIQRAQYFMDRRDAGRMRAVADTARRVAAGWMRTAPDPATRRSAAGYLAWLAAATGDRAAALDALRAAAPPATELAEYPAGAAAGSFACSQAEVLALLGDDARMLPALRRCLTLPGGYEPHYVRAEPAFADVRDDPRVRALVAEAVARRRAPVRRAG